MPGWSKEARQKAYLSRMRNLRNKPKVFSYLTAAAPKTGLQEDQHKRFLEKKQAISDLESAQDPPRGMPETEWIRSKRALENVIEQINDGDFKAALDEQASALYYLKSSLEYSRNHPEVDSPMPQISKLMKATAFLHTRLGTKPPDSQDSVSVPSTVKVRGKEINTVVGGSIKLPPRFDFSGGSSLLDPAEIESWVVKNTKVDSMYGEGLSKPFAHKLAAMLKKTDSRVFKGLSLVYTPTDDDFKRVVGRSFPGMSADEVLNTVEACYDPQTKKMYINGRMFTPGRFKNSAMSATGVFNHEVGHHAYFKGNGAAWDRAYRDPKFDRYTWYANSGGKEEGFAESYMAYIASSGKAKNKNWQKVFDAVEEVLRGI